MNLHLMQCRQFLREREKQRQLALDKRFEQAWEEAQKIISLIASKYRPKNIYQWGSLLDRRNFWEHSDIDIAVEGLESASQFFLLYGEADNLTSMPLDLIELEKIEPEFADIIRTRGKLIYERECEHSNPTE